MTDSGADQYRDPALLSSFGLVADSLYPDHSQELYERERVIEEYESQTRADVIDFAGFQTVTGDDNEARFVRWQTVRRLAEERLHIRRRGF